MLVWVLQWSRERFGSQARHVPGTRLRVNDKALCLGLGRLAQVTPRPGTPLHEDGTSVLCPCERAAGGLLTVRRRLDDVVLLPAHKEPWHGAPPCYS